MTEDLKICSKCNSAKEAAKDFYVYKGTYRSECKKCTIRKNVLYQKKVKAWKVRYVDNEQHRSYMADYYSRNKLKFAEYAKRFKERNPDYHKEYARRRKNERK